MPTTHLKVTHAEADSALVLPGWRVFTYDYADLDAANTVEFPIEAGTHVLGVAHKTVVAFDNAADLDIGDSADADGYLTQALLTPTTINNYAWSLGNTTVYAAGKYYAASNRFILVFTAVPTVGEGELRVLLSGFEV